MRAAWWRNVLNPSRSNPYLSRTVPRVGRARRSRLFLEPLEDRTAPALFTVLNTNDAGPGSLRQALVDVNLSTDPSNIIEFAIGPVGSSQTIQPLPSAGGVALPVIQNPVLIDGWSQGGPGYTGPPLIEIDGSLADDGMLGTFGFNVQADNVEIRGFAINRFANVNGNGFAIGVFGGFGAWIYGNYLGTDLTGLSARPNGGGGVWLGGSADSTRVGTKDGSNDLAEANVMAGNVGPGVLVETVSNPIAGNFIGVGSDGLTPLGNSGDGIRITGFGNKIGGRGVSEGNTIAYNGGSAVAIPSGDANSIVGNRFFSNAGLGIDLGPAGLTPNDPDDLDLGANHLQNFPVLLDARLEGGLLTIVFFVPSADAGGESEENPMGVPGATTYPILVDFYLADSDGNEGLTLLGTTFYDSLSAQSVVQVSFTPPAALAGDRLVAVATDFGEHSSEFSPAFDINVRPALALTRSSFTYAENDPATALDPSALATDSDNTDFGGGRLLVQFQGGETAADRLTVLNVGSGPGQVGVAGPVVTFGGVPVAVMAGGSGSTPLLIDFNTFADQAAVQAVLRAVAFANAADEPVTGPRIVSLLLTDGDGGISDPATMTVPVVTVDDTPVVPPSPPPPPPPGTNVPADSGTAPAPSASAPTALTLSLSGATVNEGESLTLAGQFSDEGVPGAHTVVIRWGDGTTDTLTLAPGELTFQATHAYADKGSTGRRQTDLDITVIVSNSSGSVEEEAEVTVRNVAPDVTAGPESFLAAGLVFVGSGQFTDPGLDAFEAVVDYGDGSDEEVVALRPDGSFDLAHVYATEGSFIVTITIQDDDNGTGTAGFFVHTFLAGPAEAQSAFAAPGETVQVEAGGTRVTLQHKSGGRVAGVVVAQLPNEAVSAPLVAADSDGSGADQALATYDIRALNVTEEDVVVVEFEVNSPLGRVPTLFYLDPVTNRLVPVQGSTQFPAGLLIERDPGTTLFRITLILDNTSSPRITELTGTIFTFSVPATPTPTPLTAIPVTLASNAPIDVDSSLAVTFQRTGSVSGSQRTLATVPLRETGLDFGIGGEGTATTDPEFVRELMAAAHSAFWERLSEATAGAGQVGDQPPVPEADAPLAEPDEETRGDLIERLFELMDEANEEGAVREESTQSQVRRTEYAVAGAPDAALCALYSVLGTAYCVLGARSPRPWSLAPRPSIPRRCA
ncbi:MAG: PKD domain-containing protein [Gemmataceae bacterium]|nr:PKD domain-containing protein [Gemmataceae bacterium]